MQLRERIYLDHAASTPMRPAAIDVMDEVMQQPFLMANPSSSHADGRCAAALLTRMRGYVAERFACSPEEVVFNSGGSEGDTHALFGMAALLGRPIQLAISAVEHEAVQVAATRLAQAGHTLSVIPVDSDGVVDMPYVQQLCSSGKLDLLSVMAVNNETGVVQPVAEIARLAKQHGVVLHCDAVRAVGHGFETLLQNQDIPLLNCTAHKFGGPRGVGALIQRKLKLPQLVCGGGQEHGSRAGTENLVGIAGMVSALTDATADEAISVECQRHEFESALQKQFPEAQIHGKGAKRATHITYVSFAPKCGHKLQAALDARGVSVSTGSACHDDGSVTLSPVLRAMGTAETLARGTLRISLGWNTTRQDWQGLLTTLGELLHGDTAVDLEQD